MNSSPEQPVSSKVFKPDHLFLSYLRFPSSQHRETSPTVTPLTSQPYRTFPLYTRRFLKPLYHIYIFQEIKQCIFPRNTELALVRLGMARTQTVFDIFKFKLIRWHAIEMMHPNVEYILLNSSSCCYIAINKK